MEDKTIIELREIKTERQKEDDEENEAAEYQIKANRTKISALKKVASAVYREISAQVDYSVGKYLNLTESYKTQVLMTNVQSTISKAGSLVSSTITGAMALSFLGAGPIGAAVGAAIAITSETMDLIRQYDQQNLTINLNDRYANYVGSRMGLIDNGRGTQN